MEERQLPEAAMLFAAKSQVSGQTIIQTIKLQKTGFGAAVLQRYGGLGESESRP
jgi:hypothetical protein